MAGQGHTNPFLGARHTVAAVALCCLILNIFPAAAAWADYLITGPSGETIGTSGYWIQGSLLYSDEGREPLNAYEVPSVRADDLTEEQVELRNRAMQEFRAQVLALLEQDEAILRVHTDQLKEMSRDGEPVDEVLDPDRRKELKREFRSRDKALEDLKATWNELRLPDYSLLMMRDIKILQIVSLEASVEQALNYVESGDPTNLAYAREHLRQAKSFQESFLEALPWSEQQLGNSPDS